MLHPTISNIEFSFEIKINKAKLLKFCFRIQVVDVSFKFTEIQLYTYLLFNL